MQHKVNSSFSDSVLEDFTEGYSHQVLDEYHDLDDLDNIKKSIVQALGLKMIPDPSKANVSQTEYERAHGEYLRRLQMSRAFGDKKKRKLHTFIATDIKKNIKRQKRDIFYDTDEIHELYLPLNIKNDDAEVEHANMRFLLDTNIKNNDVKIIINSIENDKLNEVVIDEILSNFTGPRWIEFDITSIVKLWHDNTTINNGLEIIISNNNINNENIINNAYLNVFTVNEYNINNKRKRRSPGDKFMSHNHRSRKSECHGNNKKCCRHEMTVIFKDLKGFEFIVQPKSFDAGYCKGRCPPRYNPAHHHAVLQSLIWKDNRGKVPRPCCAPNKLTELEILFIDDNDSTKLKISSWKNMKVLECACS
ncbi:hypothetical protein HCN44_000935 [Aphidius gifuensis]|uniref:TGF-beta family profile domain-containing protein n=2 Tax=Aphidius gifuensis TaxID=684658 RepID=A0A834XKB1_APHGI|nr:hypothetical protein HCN44_000935 [Aphidius gifuensis]